MTECPFCGKKISAISNVSTYDGRHAQPDASAGSQFWRRTVAAYRAVALLTLNALLILAFLAMIAAGTVLVRSRATKPTGPSPSGTAKPLKEEQLMKGVQYRPYVTWRRYPFAGETINVDRDGIRRTPGAICTGNSYKVFAFGGSAMWGTGSPDWGTIPAYLQAGLKAPENKLSCVTNFGEHAFVSTQEVIELVLQLRSGTIPDYILFYDGINDIFASYGSGQAGVHQDLERIAAKFECPPLIPCFKASHAVGTLTTLFGGKWKTYQTGGGRRGKVV